MKWSTFFSIDKWRKAALLANLKPGILRMHAAGHDEHTIVKWINIRASPPKRPSLTAEDIRSILEWNNRRGKTQ